MNWIRFILLCLLFSILESNHHIVNGQETRYTKQDILDKSLASWKKYQKLTRKISGGITRTGFKGASEVSPVIIKNKHNIKILGGYVVKETETFLGHNSSHSFDIQARNSRYSFKLQKQNKSTGWAITTLSRNEKLHPKEDLTQLYQKTLHDVSPHYLGPLPKHFAELHSEGKLKIEKITFRTENGKDLILLEITYEKKRHEIYLDPESHWCIKKFHFRTNEGPQAVLAKSVLDYETQSDFPPIVKNVTSNVTYATGKNEVTNLVVTEYQLSTDGGLRESDFSLSSYGFPEPVEFGITAPVSYWWLYLLVIGLVCIFLGIRLRKKAQTA